MMGQKKEKREPVQMTHKRGGTPEDQRVIHGHTGEGDRFDIRDFFLSWAPSGICHWFATTLGINYHIQGFQEQKCHLGKAGRVYSLGPASSINKYNFLSP